MKKKKILYIIDSLSAGGKERRLVELLKSITKEEENLSIKLILLGDNIHYKEVYDLPIDIIILNRIIKKDPFIFFKIFKICYDWTPKLIHVWGSMPAIYATPISKLLHIKLINSMIVDAPLKINFSKWIRSKLTLPFSDLVQSNSFSGLISYKYYGKGIVIYNGFNMNRLNNLESSDLIRKKLKIKTKYIVGMVAGFREHKDYYSFISAAKLILSNRNDVTFVCIGDGKTLKKSKELAGNTKNILFLGKIDSILSYVNIFDIAVLLTNSDSHGEGISNSIMEYMSLKKPIIATEGGGTNEIIDDYKNGILIPSP